MKKKILLCSLALLVALLLVVFLNPTVRLHISMVPYLIALKEYPPEDLQLTIYYVENCIITRIPFTVDDVKSDCFEKITIPSDELALHWDLLKNIEPSKLQPTNEKHYMNTRVYYVLEAGDSKEILTVVLKATDYYALVNGIEVEYNPALVDIIEPFVDTNKWNYP